MGFADYNGEISARFIPHANDPEVKIGYGRTEPDILLTILDATGNPIPLNDLASANITFARSRGGEFARAMAVENPPDGGRLRYSWSTSDWDGNSFKRGRWLFVIAVTDNNGRTFFLPNYGYYRLEIA